MTRQRLDSEQGSALIFALGFMVVILIIALGVHTLVGNQLKASGAFRQRVTAEYLAQGGVARAIGWFSTQSYLPPQASSLTATVPVKLTSNGAAVVLPSNHPDSYTDTAGVARTNMLGSYNTFLTSQAVTGGSYSITASLMNMQPETWEVLATAQQGGVQRQVGALLVRQSNALFRGALFGDTGVSFNGNAVTDSYDSSLGAYGGTNLFKSGNVRSNGNINLKGNSGVQGDAMPGPSKSVSLNGNAYVTGLTTPASSTQTLPAITVPAGAVNKGSISISGNNSQTLTAGNYVISSISISGNATLNIDASAGPVNLYVSGTISANGNGIVISSGSHLPQNLNIFETGNSSVSLGGNSDFYGTVYAPNSPLSLSGNAQLYGAFAGSSITLSGNGGIHFDKHLLTGGGAPGPLKLVAQWSLPS